MFTNYRALLQKIDAFVAGIRARHTGAFACRPGCAACCVAGITLWRVEAEHIRAAHTGEPPQRTAAGDRCPMLNAGECCTIYDARPVVCRLWGAPLLFPADDEAARTALANAVERSVAFEGRPLTCCHLNFVDTDLATLPTEDLVNVNTILTTLAAINHLFCREQGFDPIERVPLADC